MFEKLEQMLKENYGISNIEPDMKFKTDFLLLILLLCFVLLKMNTGLNLKRISIIPLTL